MKEKKAIDWKELITDTLTAKPDATAEKKINDAVNTELHRQDFPPNDILTFDEVAAYLRVSADTLENYLDDLPCFELGGQLLFRKTALLGWIEEREKSYRSEINHFESNQALVITIA